MFRRLFCIVLLNVCFLHAMDLDRLQYFTNLRYEIEDPIDKKKNPDQQDCWKLYQLGVEGLGARNMLAAYNLFYKAKKKSKKFPEIHASALLSLAVIDYYWGRKKTAIKRFYKLINKKFNQHVTVYAQWNVAGIFLDRYRSPFVTIESKGKAFSKASYYLHHISSNTISVELQFKALSDLYILYAEGVNDENISLDKNDGKQKMHDCSLKIANLMKKHPFICIKDL